MVVPAAAQSTGALYKNRQPGESQVNRLTNFYPLYNGANDQVDSVFPIQPVRFQQVLPGYSFSTSETRDQGTGPMFNGIPGWLSPAAQQRSTSNPLKRVAAEPVRNPLLGQHVDQFA